MIDQYNSTIEEFIQDIVDNYNAWTRSDLQGYVIARCDTTGEDEFDILAEIDRRLAEQGVGI